MSLKEHLVLVEGREGGIHYNEEYIVNQNAHFEMRNYQRLNRDL